MPEAQNIARVITNRFLVMVKDHHDILEDTFILGNTHWPTNWKHQLFDFFLEVHSGSLTTGPHAATDISTNTSYTDIEKYYIHCTYICTHQLNFTKILVELASRLHIVIHVDIVLYL